MIHWQFEDEEGAAPESPPPAESSTAAETSAEGAPGADASAGSGDDGFDDAPPRVANDDELVLDLDGFEGPIDALLTLARDQKVDLRKISILELADRYLAFIARAASPSPIISGKLPTPVEPFTNLSPCSHSAGWIREADPFRIYANPVPFGPMIHLCPVPM